MSTGDEGYKPCTTPYLCEDCLKLHWTHPSRVDVCPWCKGNNIKEITKEEAVKRGGKMAALLNTMGEGRAAFINACKKQKRKGCGDV